MYRFADTDSRPAWFKVDISHKGGRCSLTAGMAGCKSAIRKGRPAIFKS